MFAKIIKQSMILIVSLLVFGATIKSGNTIYRIITKPGFRLLILTSALIVFLAIAIIPNDNLFPTINGGKGWIHIGPVSLQIPELFKVPFIMLLANILARGKDDDRKITYWKNFFSIIFLLLSSPLPSSIDCIKIVTIFKNETKKHIVSIINSK